ncbi:MAG: SGNH/GDSL hydrolase family protein [Candidatus Thiodiazotropha endolucinida]|nr:SGNH/GDSL hydrolase family protein [Candidatus Thiodiazotropha taylori]MCW4343280.1 SGNH/GDSL hydrolase family protein [Candidatus Thiodiazotropha endolucinida]
MHWYHFGAALQQMMLFHQSPAAIIIHLGGNDLVSWSQSKLLKAFKRHFAYISSTYPNAQIIWSDILPRENWRGMESTTENLRRMNLKRKQVNRLGRGVAIGFGGKGIHHELDFSTTGLFRSDGVHLTLIGNAILLNTFEEAMDIFLSDHSIKTFPSNK